MWIMLKQIDILWNRKDKDSKTVGVGGQGEEGSEEEGREDEGMGEEIVDQCREK